MSSVLVVLALAVIGTAVVAVVIVRVLPSLQLQLVALAVLAVCLPLGTVLASGLVMFGMHGSGKIAAVAIVSTLSALGSALLVGRRLLRPLDQLQAASRVLAGGELGTRAPESGPRELRVVARSFNDMAASIETLFDARRELVAWASHDLRTPIASLRAMVEALEDGLATPEEYIPAIRTQTQILSRLVEDLFELARLDAGALTLDLRDTPLGELVAGCVGAVAPEARAHKVRLESRIHPADPAVRIAPEKIERVLLNLITNAVRHARPAGAVAVVVQPDADHVVVAVEDDGNGLAPGAPERMFERFWRDDASRARTSGGAGLGLAISQGLVEAHGGTIWAENRAGGGARVAFTLPLARVY
jgi:two-component system, OmpR family, sensor histidine kinase SaeS